MTLTERIYLDLAQDIINHNDLPPLTLPALAKHFSCSTRPIRQAVDRLIADKVLTKTDNGRLHVPDRITKRAQQKIKQSINADEDSEELEDQLLGKLIHYALEAHQDYLREEHVADEFNIGRGRLRQLFMEFASRGLLEHIPHCGWKVIPFDESDMTHFIKTRKTLEDLALCESFDKLDHNIIRDCLEKNKQGLQAKQPKEDDTFHHHMIEVSGNRYIAQFLAQYMPYYTIFSEWEAKDAEASRAACREHCRILEAMLKNDLEAARAALDAHLDTDVELLFRPRKFSVGLQKRLQRT